MGLFSRVPLADTVAEMDRARMDRYYDALACALNGREFGACYLLGYVVEMSLKVALFRYMGVRQDVDLSKELDAARQSMKLHNIKRRNLHDLGAWRLLLVEVRQREGRPLDSKFAAMLQGHIDVIDSHWRIELRYRGSLHAQHEFDEMLKSVDWIRANDTVFWEVR